MRLLIIALLLLATPATAEECFQVVVPGASGAGIDSSMGALKVNRCTGETWVLSLIAISGGNAWRWTPITTDAREQVWPQR
jgi:hypothetical protein